MSAAAGSRPPGEVLPGPSLKALRAGQTTGLSRRTLIRRALGAGVGLLAIEWLGGSLAFAWSAASAAAPKVRVGTLDDIVLTNPDLPVRDGFPTYLPAARAFVVLLDPGIGRFETGSDATGNGAALNVRALSQICPHLGCRPNPCVEDFWFRCPCHQSRYDRLGTKAAGETVRAGSARDGPVRRRGRCGRRPDDRHRGGHARAAPRRAGRPGYHPATRRRRLHMTGVLRLYPRWWRRRYGDEMRALLEVAPARRGDRRDLVRGALDAWLHPPEPSLPAGHGGAARRRDLDDDRRPGRQPAGPAGLAGLPDGGRPVRHRGRHLPAHRGRWDRPPGRRRARAVDRAGHRGGDRQLRRVDRGHGRDGRWRRPIPASCGRPRRSRWSRPPASASSSGPPTSGSARWSCSRPVAMLLPWAGAWLVFGTCWTAIGLVILVARSLWFDERRRLS